MTTTERLDNRNREESMTTTNRPEPNAKPDFLTWLALHRGYDTRIGNLADDVHRDSATPCVESLETLLDYLTHRGACGECLRSAKSAWGAWKR